MSPAEYETAIAAYLRNKRITRCPTVCVVPTRTTVAEADRAAYRAYVAAKEEAARQKKQKAMHQMLQG